MTEEEQKRDAGMRAKLKEYKRFLSVYREMRQNVQLCNRYVNLLERQNAKLVRVLTAIAESEEGIDTVPELARYASRVLAGMGYR